MHLLHAVETLSRDGGGLPVAVVEMAAAVAGKDWKTDLISSRAPDEVALDPSIRVTRVEGGATAGWRATRWFDESLEPAGSDAGPGVVVHQHGLWAPLPVASGRFAKRRGLPLVLSPHGMLEPWAMAYRRWKKRIAWPLYQHQNLESASVLHAASRAEGERFRALGFRQPVAILPHGVKPVAEAPLDPEAVSGPKPRRELLMLSRIHPKKGLGMLLEAWAQLAPADWTLVIAGNDDGGHQPALEAMAARLGLGEERVQFRGPLFGVAKDTVFRRADLFILPSYSENFGIVVPEALQYGVPVITTADTPWGKLEERGCGWWIDPTVEAIAATLREAMDLTDEERLGMGQRGIDLVEEEHRWPRIAEGYRSLYRWLVGEGPRPSCLDLV